MIVSGFTQKHFEEEYLHGSALDHKHCVTCVQRACKVRPDNVNSCEVVDCPRGCPGRYHGCKEAEHTSLCPEERVECINRGYGCPVMLARRKLQQHLPVCPASVIYCSAEWNRSPLVQVEAGEIATILKEKFYTDCGQLDTALAMRDHRVLVDLLLAPRRTRRILRNPLTQVYPAAPIGRPTPSSLASDAGPCEGSSKDLSFDEEDNKWDSSQSWLEMQMEHSKRENHLYDASRQTALSLSSTLNYISDRLDCRTGGLSVPDSSSGSESAVPVDSSTRLTVEQPVGVTANEGKMSSPIVSNKDGRNSASKLNKNKGNCPADSLCGADSRLSAEREADSAAGCSRDVDPCERDKQETLIMDGQALSSLLSVSMGVECITKYQPKQGSTYTFLCAQELRRDEFPHHFHNVHNLIQSNLNGWLEQRCPLAYLGCPFSFRRFRPSTPGMTVCHSWLLESFGLTGQSPEADASHQTPRHLLPAGPETARVQSSSTPSEGCERSAAEQAVSGSGGAEVFTDAAAACQNPSSAQPQGYRVGVESQAESQHHQKSSDKISEVACDTAHAASLSGVDQDRSLKEGSFSALLDSINLDTEESHTRQTLPSAVKTLKYLDTDGHQNDSLESGQGTREQECSTLRVQGSIGCDKHSEESASEEGVQVPRSPTGSHFSHKAPLFQVSGRHLPNSQASILLDKNPEGKQVIYTGVYANSCVRVDRCVPAVPPNSAGAPTETGSHRMQLTDLPVEILRYITTFLDSFSLCNMALVSRMMRELCSSLLHERGIVSLIWEKRHVGAKVSWQVVGKRWSFSTCFDPVESWSFTGHNPIPDHLITCPYNQDRFRHSDKFSIIPLNEAPMNIQIRDMLQERLRRRRRILISEPSLPAGDARQCFPQIFREYREEMIWHSFYWQQARETWPHVGLFADLLVALGGTLPP